MSGAAVAQALMQMPVTPLRLQKAARHLTQATLPAFLQALPLDRVEEIAAKITPLVKS